MPSANELLANTLLNPCYNDTWDCAKCLTEDKDSKTFNRSKYSQTCIKRSPLGQRKSGLIRPMKCSMTGQEKGDILIQMTA
jgi:hypothetical protein